MNALSKLLAVGMCLVGAAAASAQGPSTAPAEAPTTAPVTAADYNVAGDSYQSQLEAMMNQQLEMIQWVMNQQPSVELYISYRNAGGTRTFRDFAASIAPGFYGVHQLPANCSNERTEWEKWRSGFSQTPGRFVDPSWYGALNEPK